MSSTEINIIKIDLPEFNIEIYCSSEDETEYLEQIDKFKMFYDNCDKIYLRSDYGTIVCNKRIVFYISKYYKVWITDGIAAQKSTLELQYPGEALMFINDDKVFNFIANSFNESDNTIILPKISLNYMGKLPDV